MSKYLTVKYFISSICTSTESSLATLIIILQYARILQCAAFRPKMILKNTPPDKMQFLNNHVTFLYQSFLIHTGEILLQLWFSF